MYIEHREVFGIAYLVNEITNNEDAFCWKDCSQKGFKEYGNGNRMFLFEGAGNAYQPFAFDLIHANTKEEAERIVQEKYGQRLKDKTLIRCHEELEEVIDER